MSDTQVLIRIGRNIREIRLKNGLSLEQLAKKISISYQQIQRYEFGRSSSLPAHALLALSKALKVPVSAFFEGLGESRRRSHEPTDDEWRMIRTMRTLPRAQRKSVYALIVSLAPKKGKRST